VVDFRMNFGTSIDSAGGVRFRLWAPQARQVDLCLQGASAGKHFVPMAREPEGWFGVHHLTASPGDWYQFMINGELLVPDPASRYQAGDIHGPSVVCDPEAYLWHDAGWLGRPWEEAVIYELHVGCFSEAGTYRQVTERLDYLVQLGVTAIECMPLAQFPGNFNWGYDGALLFAPCSVYGRPEELKELVDAAHQRGLMVFLDVVYNHFGPEGNYLYVYARDAFFTERFKTPWGMAINYCGEQSKTVRQFYIANVLYWLEEFHMDGLRFDAVHSIFDYCRPDILEEIAEKVHAGPGSRRHIHLILENDDNCAGYLTRKPDGQPRYFSAQWNDDLHHACHVLATGETDGYYQDYADRPIHHLGRCLTEGFAYQGEISPFRDNARRGQPSAHLPPLAFVSFLQNHDQIGNRALGERLTVLADKHDLAVLTALFLLAPSPPLLFMGEEFGAESPFCFFCDFSPELAKSVVSGRLKEFARFARFNLPENLERIPDPTAMTTFLRSKLNWQSVDKPCDNATLPLYRQLLHIRRQAIIPCLQKRQRNEAGMQVFGEKALQAWWTLTDDEILVVLLNLQDHAVRIAPASSAAAPGKYEHGEVLYQYCERGSDAVSSGTLLPKSIVWLIDRCGGQK